MTQDTERIGGMTRAEHLQWSKDRALEYVAAGDLPNAFTSLTSDLTKHPDLAGASELQNSLGLMQYMGGHLDSALRMREWIEGFA
jgi:hypothetical protein